MSYGRGSVIDRAREGVTGGALTRRWLGPDLREGAEDDLVRVATLAVSRAARRCMIVQLATGAGAARAATTLNVPADGATSQAAVDAITPQLVADPPELDPTFGTGGKLVAGFGSSILGMALQADGKIVAVGADADVVRFTAAGALDTAFDGDGHAASLVGNPTDVAVDGNGKIVVVGTNSPGGYCCEVAVARYNSNGTPDATFDGDGVATGLFGTPDAFGAQTVAITPGNKILVGGSPRIAQFTSTGTLDASFGVGGVATTGASWVSDIAVQGDGKIVAVGGTSGLDLGIARFTSAGVLDSAFGGDGLVTTDLGGNDAANAVAIQGDGRIVVAGTAAEHFVVVRYDSTGALDPSFGGDGSVSTTFTGENIENANSVSIQADGKIVAVGRAFHDYHAEWAIARYATDGWLEGQMVTDFDKSDDTATVVAIQTNGRILVAGGQGGCETVCSWTMARYTGVTPLRTLAGITDQCRLRTVTVGAAQPQRDDHEHREHGRHREPGRLDRDRGQRYRHRRDLHRVAGARSRNVLGRAFVRARFRRDPCGRARCPERRGWLAARRPPRRDRGRPAERRRLGIGLRVRTRLHLELRVSLRSDGPVRRPAAPPRLCDRPDRRQVGNRQRPVRGRLLRPEWQRLHMDHAAATEPVHPARHGGRSRRGRLAGLRHLGDSDEDRPLLEHGTADPLRPGQHEPRRDDLLEVQGALVVDDGSSGLPDDRRRRVGRLHCLDERQHGHDRALDQSRLRGDVARDRASARPRSGTQTATTPSRWLPSLG